MPARPYEEYLYPLVLLRVNGIPSDDLLERMVRFEYNDSAKKVDVAKFVFIDADRRLFNDARFEVDSVWEIRWGYPNDMSLRHEMRLKSYAPNFTESDEVEITVTLFGRLGELLRKKGAQNWGIGNSSDVAKKIAARWGLKAIVEPSDDKDVPLVQHQGVDDFTFLNELADRIDFDVFETGKTLYYRSKATGRSEAPRMVFDYGARWGPSILKSFQPIVKLTKGGKIKGLGVDTQKGKKNPVEFASGTKNNLSGALGDGVPSPNDPVDTDAHPRPAKQRTIDRNGNLLQVDLADGKIVGVSKARQEEAASDVVLTPETSPRRVKQLAKAKRRHVLERLVQAKAEFIGTPRIRTHVTYVFRGMDRRVAGLWYTTEVDHTIDNSGYSVSATLRKGAYGRKTGTKNRDSKNTHAGKAVNDGSPPSNATRRYTLVTGRQVTGSERPEGQSYSTPGRS